MATIRRPVSKAMATADYVMRVTMEPRAPKPGQAVKFRLAILHPLTGAMVKDFAEVHDKLFHLFVVSRDMSQWSHVHPVLEKDGSFTVEINDTEPKSS